MNKFQKMGALALALSPLSAFAAAPDTTAIKAAITDGQTASIEVALAFAVAVLALKAIKLLKRS